MRRLLVSIILCIGVSLAAAEFDPSLQGVRFFAYQLQNFDTPEGLQALADSHYDLLVIDQTRSIKGSEGYNSAADVASLHATLGSSVNPKKVVCYLDAGQAEDFRWYWQDGWSVGNPAWILAPDPDWPGDYPVKFWDPEWKALMKQDLAMIVADGYDGAYLDWMEIYAFPPLVQAAQAEGKDPREELVAFIRELRDYARSLDPDFFFIAQNAAEQGACREWLDLFSGIGQEDVWFTWGDGEPGDVPQDPDLTAAILSDLALWKAAGKVVFNIEYAQEPANVSTAYANGKALGFITYATLKELDQISDTPPTDYKIYNLTAGASGENLRGHAFSPDSQWMAFSMDGKGIYKVKTDGSSLQLILSDPDHYYSISNGSSWNGIIDRICISSNRGGNWDIWSIKPDGSGLIQLTSDEDVEEGAIYSPNGEWIAYDMRKPFEEFYEIYKENIASGEIVRLTNNQVDDTCPTWSPDGNTIVFSSTISYWSGDIWEMDTNGGSWTKLSNGDSFGYIGPTLSSDARWLAYTVITGDTGAGPYLLGVQSLSNSSCAWFPRWGKDAHSPNIIFDGKILAIEAGYPERSDIWTMPIYLPPPSDHERPVARP